MHLLNPNYAIPEFNTKIIA